MFKNLFKTDPQISYDFQGTEKHPAYTPFASKETIDEQIHREAQSAQELLLSRAKEVLSKPALFPEQKQKRLDQLKALGFTNIKEVIDLTNEKKEVEEQQKMLTDIKYYKLVYPFHKFIDQPSVKMIVDKYKLVLARVSSYISDIPVKNQQEIVDFKVRRKDIREPDEMNTGWMRRLMFATHFHHIPTFGLTHLGYDDDWRSREARENERKRRHDEEMLPGKDLLIICPEHKLDTSMGRIKDGILIKDPIVLQPVISGYLMVSAWLGDEDPKLFEEPVILNETMN